MGEGGRGIRTLGEGEGSVKVGGECGERRGGAEGDCTAKIVRFNLTHLQFSRWGWSAVVFAKTQQPATYLLDLKHAQNFCAFTNQRK